MVVVADETWIGGTPRFKHASKRKGVQGPTDKTPVLSIINTKKGEVLSKVVPDVSGETLRSAIAERAVTKTTTLHTDSATS